jgi:hypothetical protein
MKNAMNVVPGEFVANGHDYRADIARFVREVYDLPCTNEQLSRIESALRRYEVMRQQQSTHQDNDAQDGARESPQRLHSA